MLLPKMSVRMTIRHRLARLTTTGGRGVASGGRGETAGGSGVTDGGAEFTDGGAKLTLGGPPTGSARTAVATAQEINTTATNRAMNSKTGSFHRRR